MVLPRMNLSDYAAYSGTVISQKYEQILNNKSILGKFVHDLHMG